MPKVQSVPELAPELWQRIRENKSAIELAKGGEITGSLNDVRIYETLQDSSKGPKLRSLLESIPKQAQIGNALGMLKTMQSVSDITKFNPEDEPVQAAEGDTVGSYMQREVTRRRTARTKRAVKETIKNKGKGY